MTHPGSSVSGSPATSGSSRQSGDLPKLSEIRSSLDAQRPVAGRRSAVGKIELWRITVPIDTPMEPIWSLTTVRGLPRATMAAWLDNGIMLAQVPAERLGELAQAMPRGSGVKFMRLLHATRWTPVSLANASGRSLPIRLAYPGRGVFRFTLEPGRTQWLMRLTQPASGSGSGSGQDVEQEVGQADRAGTSEPVPPMPRQTDDQARPSEPTELIMVPHHYVVKQTVQPRLPQQMVTDGHVFSPLQLQLPMPEDRWLLVGLDVPAEIALPSPAAGLPRRNGAADARIDSAQQSASDNPRVSAAEARSPAEGSAQPAASKNSPSSPDSNSTPGPAANADANSGPKPAANSTSNSAVNSAAGPNAPLNANSDASSHASSNTPSDAPSQSNTSQPSRAERILASLDQNLGRALFTASRLGKPVAVFLLIHVRPPADPDADASSP